MDKARTLNNLMISLSKTKIQNLFESINSTGIRYCHWKSNISLAESLSGQTDIDLLISRKDARAFRSILDRLDFQPAVMTDGERFPSVEHYYGLDEESGILVHVHAYYQVITGESLTKNYHFPIEEMLLENTREVETIYLPRKSAELIVFTLRMMLKHTSLVELVLLQRYWHGVKKELTWLLDSGPILETRSLLKTWLPSIDEDLFLECIAALEGPAPILRRIYLGHQLRKQLKFYSRHSSVHAWFSGIQKFSLTVYRRLVHSQKSMSLQNGGAIIAFVGPEATGKSTLIKEMNRWLGEHFSVQQIHVGKPMSTFVSFVPNLFLPALRSIFPSSRSTHISSQSAHGDQQPKENSGYPLIFAIRSALLAYDRWSLLSRAYSQASNGTLVLCDRYPSIKSGAPDSPQLAHLSITKDKYSLRRRCRNIETRLYRQIPPADLIIYLTAPIEVTISRNANREKTEPEDYVRWRHAVGSNLDFGDTPIQKINTDQPFEDSLLQIKRAIWNAL